MTRKIQNDQSLSIELDDEDLLDIDGSDDPTTSFAGKAVLAKLRSPKKKAKPVQVASVVVDDPTVVIRDDVRETIPFPMKLSAQSPFSAGPFSRPGTAAPVNAKMAPKSPTISPAPPVKNRNATSSYPPIAISVAPRDRQMSFISEKPSRAGWIAAAVLGVLILVGGSLKVAAPKAVAPAAEPTPVAAAEPAPAPETAPEEPKVVTFGENQGVSIKSKAETKADTKAEAKADAKKPAAAAPHFVPAKPATKPAASSKVDNSLAVSKEEKKEKDIPATSHDSAPSSNMSKAEQKKLKSIEQDLADLQLKAAAR